MKYKEITLKTSERFDASPQRFVKSFFDEFDGHIYFEPLGAHEVKLFLNSIDFERFRVRALELKSHSGEEKIMSIVDDFVSAVDGIGSYGLKSGKRVYVDFNKERKVKNRKEKSAKRTVSVKKNERIARENTLPAKYENVIVCGDSLDVMRKLPDNCIDVMLTSPPYNFGLEYDNGEDDKRWDSYFSQLFTILEETKRVLKHGGRMIIMCNHYSPIIFRHTISYRNIYWTLVCFGKEKCSGRRITITVNIRRGAAGRVRATHTSNTPGSL